MAALDTAYPADNLKTRFVRSTLWLSSSTAMERVIRLGRTMILSRLLLPEDFGLIALGTAIALALESLTETGARQCIIQSQQGGTEKFLNAAWWVDLARRSLTFLIVYLSAPQLSELMAQPQLTAVIQIAGSSILFKGLASPKMHVLEKEMKYRDWVLITQGSQIAGSILTVVLAFLYRTPLILAIGFAIESAVQCVLSYVFCPFLPKLRIDRPELKQIFKFTAGMIGIPAVMLIVMRADVFVIGKTMGMSLLGGYSIALGLASLPSAAFSSVIGRLLIPAYSKKKSNIQELKTFVLDVTRKTALIGIPFILSLSLVSRSLLAVLYGNQYAQYGQVFSLLCILMLVNSASSIVSSLCYALGNPALDRRGMILRGLVLVAVIYPATVWWGLMGTALSLIFSTCLYFVYHLALAARLVNIKPKEYLSEAKAGAVLGGLLAMFFYLAMSRIPGSSDVVTVVTGALLFIAVLGGYFLYDISKGKKSDSLIFPQ